jgi:hypothetical protein
MVLPNPDEIPKNRSISLKEALALYNADLTVVVNDPAAKRESDNLREAFIRAFMDLEEYDEVAEREREKQRIEEERKQKEHNEQKKKEAQLRNKELKLSERKIYYIY